MARYLSGIRKQLQDASDLFTARYGKSSRIAETAVKALVSATLLEHELMLLENETRPDEAALTQTHAPERAQRPDPDPTARVPRDLHAGIPFEQFR